MLMDISKKKQCHKTGESMSDRHAVMNRTNDFDQVKLQDFTFGDPLTSARTKFHRVVEHEK